jgi:hypothetical protein
MKKNLSLIQLAILGALFFACSKDSNVTRQEKLSVSNALADIDTTGYSGAMACYDTYFNTLKNPPSGSIPGDAQIDLNTCLSPYRGSSGTGPNKKLLPPAPKVVLTQFPVPPDAGTRIDDNLRYVGFFHLTVLEHPTDADYTTASVTFDRFSSIVCDAIAENITFPDPSNIDKMTAGVTYATNHPDRFVSDAEKDEFLRFLSFVFQYPDFIITIGRSALRTDINPFATTASCVNLVIKLSL